MLSRTVVGLRFISRLPPGSSQLLKSRMNPPGKSLFIGNSNQEISKTEALLTIKRRKQRLLVLPRHFADSVQSFFSTFCEVKRIQATVIRVCSPLHKTPLLKVVE